MSGPAKGSFQAIRKTVGQYYAERLREFGPTPQGVDWNSAESQALRFDKLLELVNPEAANAGTLLDVGCGYGALFDHLKARGLRLGYCGFDVSEAMIEAARKRHQGSDAIFTSAAGSPRTATYAVASGIFNVKLHHPVDEWREYAVDTIGTLHALSTRGFAFNMLSLYSDPERRRDDLFYADPGEVFDLCKRRFSSRVALLHDYPLYEFTIIVRK